MFLAIYDQLPSRHIIDMEMYLPIVNNMDKYQNFSYHLNNYVNISSQL